MLRLIPLASPLNRPEAVSALTAKLLDRIRGLGIPAAIDAGESESDPGEASRRPVQSLSNFPGA